MAVMKSVICCMASLLLIVAAPMAGSAADAPPRIHFPAENHTFSPVTEGTGVTYDFVVENRGGSALEISRVRTD